MIRRRLSTAGIAALPESAMPSASAIEAIVEAVPIVLHEPADRLIAASASRNSAVDMVPALIASDICQSAVPEPIALAAEPAVEHRPARDHDRRDADRGRAHQERRRGLVAAREEHHAVDRVRPQRLLHVHRAEVAVHHRRRAQRALRRAEHRKLHRQAASLVDAVRHPLRKVAQVRVAGRELRPGVADADDRPPVRTRRPANPGSASTSGGRSHPWRFRRTIPAI